MGREYGLQICKEVLHFLSTDQPIAARLERAFSEIGIIKYTDDNHTDVSFEHFNDIQTLKEIYISRTDSKLSVGKDGFLISSEEKELRELSEKFVDLCVEIIKDNAVNLD